MNRKISVKAIVIRNKKILLLRPLEQKGSVEGWDGPGGHVKQKESLVEALIREVFEETGLKIEKVLPIKILTIPQSNTNYLIFLCMAPRGKVILSKEHIAFKWVDFKQLEELTKIDFGRELLEIKKLIERLIDHSETEVIKNL